MAELTITNCTAFEGSKRLAAGKLAYVAMRVKDAIDRDPGAAILIFDDVTSEVVELDCRGTAEDVQKRLAERTGFELPAAIPGPSDKEALRGPGRPKLGVVPREVTLLPRHWDWLNSQPGGASVALRKLVEAARHANDGSDLVRKSRESSFRFMSAMAGDQPGFEESTRALFAGNKAVFDAQIESWPVDVRDHAKKLAAAAFQ